jgi:hypothetical protein
MDGWIEEEAGYMLHCADDDTDSPRPITHHVFFKQTNKQTTEQKAATTEEMKGLLQSLDAQYQRDRLAIEGAYLAQRRELEEALAAQEQQQSR